MSTTVKVALGVVVGLVALFLLLVLLATVGIQEGGSPG